MTESLELKLSSTNSTSTTLVLSYHEIYLLGISFLIDTEQNPTITDLQHVISTYLGHRLNGRERRILARTISQSNSTEDSTLSLSGSDRQKIATLKKDCYDALLNLLRKSVRENNAETFLDSHGLLNLMGIDPDQVRMGPASTISVFYYALTNGSLDCVRALFDSWK